MGIIEPSEAVKASVDSTLMKAILGVEGRAA